MTQIQKPEHNRYDNIWEIRQTGYPTKEQMADAFNGSTILTEQDTLIGRGLIFVRVENFISVISRKRDVRLPIWKIVIPDLDKSNGAIYYVAESPDYTRIFRGTYGYCGTGPHESALIEACFEKLGLTFKVRDGDFLLCFLYPKQKEISN